MDASQLASLVDHVRLLPAEGPGRDRQLHRLTDRHAAAEAAAALRSAAARAGQDAGSLAGALSSASAMWDAVSDGFGWRAENAATQDRLREAVASPAFLSLVPVWIRELREVAAERPGTGACTLATALQLWSWTMNHFQAGGAARSEWGPRAIAELTEALCPLLAARCLVLEIAGTASAVARPEDDLRVDLCHVHAAHAAAAIGAACAELVFGYRRHLVWDAEGYATCYSTDDLDELEGLMPGIACAAYVTSDVVETNGSHAAKEGPCARIDGIETFTHLRTRLDRCLTGARLAKERAAAALARAAANGASTQRATGGD